MVKEVVWLKKASENFDNIIQYLITDWSALVAEDFYKSTMSIIYNLKEFPALGSVSNKSKVLRKVLISKHNYLVYRIKGDRIIIIRIIDTRKKSK